MAIIKALIKTTVLSMTHTPSKLSTSTLIILETSSKESRLSPRLKEPKKDKRICHLLPVSLITPSQMGILVITLASSVVPSVSLVLYQTSSAKSEHQML
jgi:hypothetical protein